MKFFAIILLSVFCYASSSSPAYALSVTDSVHNFAELGGSPCGYCHTVHNSLGGSGLMNPGFGGFPTITKVYSSATRVYKSTKAIVDVSDAPLCLACHDKTAVDANQPNLQKVKDRMDARPSINIGNAGTDLSNDHPVGFVFDPALSPTKIKTPVKAHVTFGPTRDQMWCSSCHNVHNNQFGNFLVMSNTGSALCLDCHIK